MKKFFCYVAIAACSLFAISSCSDDDDYTPGPAKQGEEGLFVVCNGNYMSGNGSLSFYNFKDNSVENNVFERANGMKLGDTAQSMTIADGKGWICVNGSNVIYAIDVDSYEVKGQVKGITSPRNVTWVGDNRLYVTSLYDNRIAIVNSRDYSVSGYVAMPQGVTSTEQVVKVGKYAYVNCWSYQKEIIKIDTTTDEVVDRLEVGIQPESMALAGDDKLWVLCDGGGWSENPVGFEAPSLVCVDLKGFEVDRRVALAEWSVASKLNYYGGYLYWIDGGVQRMSVNATEAPTTKFIASSSYGVYALGVNPANGDVYVGDAIDYMQNGVVVRYDARGEEVGRFTVGIIPAGFCFK